jgi:replication factor C subunit 3/5
MNKHSSSKSDDSGSETDSDSESKSTGKIIPKLTWVEKYRPSKWSQIIGNKQTISTIRKLVEGGGDDSLLAVPHMLFSGPPGSGKTTSAIIAMKEMYGDAADHMVLELNASNDRGIDVVRQKIIGFVNTSNYLYKACGIATPKHTYKLVILDEVDWMTNEAQATLRRLMEETSDNARFCLICNYQNKIDPAIQSRCVPFRFQPLDAKSSMIKLSEISEAEGVSIDTGALSALCDLTNGDMRKCINTLQLMSLSKLKIVDVDVYRHFGIIDKYEFRKLIATLNSKSGGQTKAYRHLSDLVATNGMDLKNVMSGIYRHTKELDMADKHRCRMLVNLARLEICMGSTECDRIHIGTLIGILADWHRENKDTGSSSSSSNKKKHSSNKHESKTDSDSD